MTSPRINPTNSRPRIAADSGIGQFLCGVLACSVFVALAGCGGEKADSAGVRSIGQSGATSTEYQINEDVAAGLDDTSDDGVRGLADLNFGGGIDSSRTQASNTRGVSGDRAVVNPDGRSNRSVNARASGNASGGTGALTPVNRPTSRWVIVLFTFSSENHLQAARNMTNELPKRIDPQLASAYVYEQEAGSMVVFGNYRAPDDSQMESDLNWIRSIKFNGRNVFPRAMKTRIVSRPDPATLDETNLLHARYLNPDVDPLYTLEVAMWTAADMSDQALDDAARQAEAYARRLRAQDFVAFYHHDIDQGISSVTVGLFNHKAIHVQSLLESDMVVELRKRFPHLLVNGEKAEVPLVDSNPQLGTGLLKPRLVNVPDL